MDNNKSYFYQSFAIVVISIAALLVFKQFLPRKIFTETTGNTKNVVVDSLMLEAVEKDVKDPKEKDTLSNTKITFDATNGVTFPSEDFEEYKGYQHLISFYESLLQLETTQQGKVRIAYFGDSMTDGDMIVKDFRSKFQEEFGGEGVGFVNITSESAPSRTTLNHQFSSNWKTQSYLNVKKPASPFGVNGHVFFAKRDTVYPVWVKYKALHWRHVSQLNGPVLYYGKSDNKNGKVAIINGKDTIFKKLDPVNLVNTLDISGDVKSLRAEFINATNIPFYGFDFDNGKGVHVDNFSNRGNSGLPIATFDTDVMKAFNEKLNYNLIVLHYGTNVLNYGSYNYTWYEKRMARVVNHLRECFPGVAILVVSTADKSTKYGLEMKTDSAVVPLTKAQKKYAVQTNAAYVNLFTLMGGDGSMVKWAEDVAPSANKDYTHFNFRGSKKISELIYNQIHDGYIQYKKLRGIKAPAVKKPAKQDTVTGKPQDANAK